MVMMPGPVFDAVEAVQDKGIAGELIMLTPRGKRLDQAKVAEFARSPRLLLLCGRYEGFDERIREGLAPTEISIGDYVTNGGETPAMVLIEAVMRLIPGVLGDEESAMEDSFSRPDWIEYPQYTRPPVYRGMSVPDVLLSGDHARIASWREQQAKQMSQQRTNREKGS